MARRVVEQLGERVLHGQGHGELALIHEQFIHTICRCGGEVIAYRLARLGCTMTDDCIVARSEPAGRFVILC